LPLTDLIRTAHATPGAEAIFNNAAQHWNHAQFWNGVRPKGGGAIPGELERWSRHSAASRPSGLIS
jgi:Fe-Mn family superoxide dismutase